MENYGMDLDKKPGAGAKDRLLGRAMGSNARAMGGLARRTRGGKRWVKLRIMACPPDGEVGVWYTSDSVHIIWAGEAGAMGKAGSRRRRQVWVRLNLAGRILLSTGEESDATSTLS